MSVSKTITPIFLKGFINGNNLRGTATQPTLRVSQEGFGQIERSSHELYLLGSGSIAFDNISSVSCVPKRTRISR